MSHRNLPQDENHAEPLPTGLLALIDLLARAVAEQAHAGRLDAFPEDDHGTEDERGGQG